MAAMCGCVLFFIGHFVKTKCIIMFAFDNRHTKLRGIFAIFGQYQGIDPNGAWYPSTPWLAKLVEITRLPGVSGDY